MFTQSQSAGSEGHAQQCVSGNTNKGRSECPHHTQCTAGRAVGHHHLTYHNLNMLRMEEEGQKGGVRMGEWGAVSCSSVMCSCAWCNIQSQEGEGVREV